MTRTGRFVFLDHDQLMRRRVKGNEKVAIGYTRVSTEDQKLGPEAQRTAIEAFAKREGIVVVAWFADDGVSGATAIDERIGLLAALAALKEHGAGALIAAKRDRIARDVVISATLDRLVQAAGAKIRTADNMSDATGPEGEFMRVVIDGAAQYERGLIRARTRAALQAKKALGERVGHVPYGFDVDGRKLVPNEGEQATMQTVREMKANGAKVSAIVVALRAMGAVSRTGKPFIRTQVVRMLVPHEVRAESVRGELSSAGE